jgi:hypothetical protein
MDRQMAFSAAEVGKTATSGQTFEPSAVQERRGLSPLTPETPKLKTARLNALQSVGTRPTPLVSVRDFPPYQVFHRHLQLKGCELAARPS